MQQLIVLGNVGRDPEVKTLPSGTTVCNFSIASSERWTDKASGEKREETTWFNIAAYGRQAEVLAQYVRKGAKLQVIGTVKARAYMGQDGNPVGVLDLRVNSFNFVESANAGGESHSNDAGDAGTQDMDDIPF